MNYIPEEFKARTIPTFIKVFLSNHKISDDDKYKFIKQFFIRYITDDDYREITQCWYIFIIDNRYERVTSYSWFDTLSDFEKSKLTVILIKD